MTAADPARAAAERAARESYGRLVAFLAARTGDLAGAEDALGEAFAAALAGWPRDGVPANPEGWLLTVARRRQTDERRRRALGDQAEPRLALAAEELAAASAEAIPDRRLALMFACAHPAVEPAARTPLMLQSVLGLTAAQIAEAFLTPPAAMGQRLVRAKARLKASGAAFEVPDAEAWPARLEAVLDAVYAAYTRGWSAGDELEGTSLAEEAIWLGQLVSALLPEEPEAKGVLALMLYSDARRPARRSASGDYVPLQAQDTGLWRAGQIAQAEQLLRVASAAGPSGRFQIEAAIQSAHVARRLTGEDTWPAILALYDRLSALAPSPVVTLNRAIARARVEGPAAGLAEIKPLAADPRMADYQPYWAGRGRLLAELGRTREAREALTLAMGLTADAAVRRYLQARLAELA